MVFRFDLSRGRGEWSEGRGVNLAVKFRS